MWLLFASHISHLLNHTKSLMNRFLILISPGWKLRFTLGPSLQPYNVRLFCNHPLDSKTSFERNKYYELKWSCTAGKPCDDADRFADLIACIAGSFHFYVAYKDVGEKE